MEPIIHPNAELEEFATFSTIEPMILQLVYKKDAYLDLETAQKIVAFRKEIQEGPNVFVFVDSSGLKGVSKEAHNYLGGDGAEGLLAGAVVAGNPLSAMIVNVFLMFKKSPVPLKMFYHHGTALDWLRERKREYLSGLKKDFNAA